MYKIVFSTLASLDIALIKSYIKWKLNNPSSAETIVNKIETVIRSLDCFPLRYPVTSSVGKNIRRIPIKKYNIYYSVNESEKTVTIMRILYAGIDIRKITFE